MKKYPRTPHFIYSPNIGRDDRHLSHEEEIENFQNKNVIVTEKMDGENTTMTSERMYARSPDFYNPALWRTKVRKLYGEIKYKIPVNLRICGENMQGIHSIEYINLQSPFYVFTIFEDDTVLSWKDTFTLCYKLGLIHVPVIYIGKYNKQLILEDFDKYIKTQPNEVEGFVVRNNGAFNESDFHKNVAKYVRKDHVQTDEHWTKHWKEAKC
jgi:ATP-dependent RNA circularization protein (DNA/RNA ligase family)